MTWFSIRPRGVWFFRDGRPFNAEEDNAARSMFPPTPLTVQGALRQKISESNGLSFRAYKKGEGKLAQQVGGYIGTHEAQKVALDTGAFRMRGPFVGLSTQDGMMPLFPCPADLLSGAGVLKVTAPQQEKIMSDIRAKHPDLRFVAVDDTRKNMPEFWMTGELFQDYLDGKTLTTDITPKPEISGDPYRDVPDAYDYYHHTDKTYRIFRPDYVYKPENRFGVSTNSATSFREEGMLYQAQFVRPTQHISLLVDVSGEHDAAHVVGQMTMGGEQRQAITEPVTLWHFPDPPATLAGQFKIIFLTPAYFGDGWLPTHGDWSQWFGADVTLVSAALYKPQRIGGWNSAKGDNGTPRPMHNYVAPGSVYYFTTSGAIENLPTAITESPDNIHNAAHIGFGQVAYAPWNYINEDEES